MHWKIVDSKVVSREVGSAGNSAGMHIKLLTHCNTISSTKGSPSRNLFGQRHTIVHLDRDQQVRGLLFLFVVKCLC